MKFFKYLILSSFLLFTACLQSNDPYNDTNDLAYLEEYEQKDGVTTTNSGLMYRVIEQSEEGVRPASDQLTIVSYKAESVDQYYNHENFSTDRFDFTIIKPENMISFAGIGEAVQLMREGDRYELVLPSELALNSGRVFTFDLELESVIQEDQEQFYETNANLEGIEVTESGLQYKVIEEGTGDTPHHASEVKVRYKGYYTSGYVFDQSPGNDTAPLHVSNVIPGFSEGLQLMKEGGTYQFFIPPALGYGFDIDRHPQYGEALLIFEVELVETN